MKSVRILKPEGVPLVARGVESANQRLATMPEARRCEGRDDNLGGELLLARCEQESLKHDRMVNEQ